jgi:dinuclear metal center YbgI/SA1388 family protein
MRLMAADRDELIAYADALLEIGRFRDAQPNGAQVLGSREVTRIVCGVSSNRELLERARAARAQLVLVHHGLFWSTEPQLVDARMRGRLQALFDGEMTLAAYHLPLDAHPELGNNARLAARLGVSVERPFAEVGLGGSLPQPLSLSDLVARVRETTGREPLVLPGGPDAIARVAISSGAGGYGVIQAAREGYDAFVTGEPEEMSTHAARELGITLIAGGHHATERLGVQALGAHLAERFGLAWEYVEVENPV